MKIYIHCKRFFKESPETQTSILDAISCLYQRIHEYEIHNIAFSRIFNDETTKYDQFNHFFVYKSHRGRLQLRILYTYFYEDNVPIILIQDYAVKKKNNKEYIKQFSYAKMLDSKECFKAAKLVKIYT